MRAALIAIASLLCLYAACPAPAPPPTTAGPRPPPPATDPTPSDPPPVQTPDGNAGKPCQTNADCGSGVCEGQGCGADAPGTCAPAARGCTRDLREYCGCDGKTFRASGSCPGQRYSAKGACP